MKKCPDCAEEVQDEARVCRYCGFRFEPPVRVTGAAQAPERLGDYWERKKAKWSEDIERRDAQWRELEARGREHRATLAAVRVESVARLQAVCKKSGVWVGMSKTAKSDFESMLREVLVELKGRGRRGGGR